ncbi:hypothetical protein EPUL_005077, partial [Erysiphe pulchra]
RVRPKSESIVTTNKKNVDTLDKKAVNLEQEISINPFDLIGSWDNRAIEDILVTFSEMELTHDIVGKSQPSDQYWSSSIELSKACYRSKIMRIDNVSIPYSSEKEYGHNYIYICLPEIIEKLIKTNAAKKFKNVVGSKYHGEAGEWWKPAYKIKGVFKATDKNQIHMPVSVEKILNYTKMGVRANLLIEFSIKRTIFSMENVILVKIISAFITAIGVDIKPPTPLGIIPGQPMPQDIISDDIMKKLKEFQDAHFADKYKSQKMNPTSSKESHSTSDDEDVNLERKISVSPFDMISSWDEEKLANVSLNFQNLSRVVNLISEYSVTFEMGYYKSKSIRINDVQIPYSSESGYGHNHIYICLPDIIEKFIKAKASKVSQNIIGSKFRGVEGEWWKPAYEFEGVFKVTDKFRVCTSVSVEKILNHTKKGIRANLVVEFFIRLSGWNYSEKTISVKIISGFITSMGVDIKPPTPRGVIPGHPMPQDITNDDIMEKLEEFK